MQRHSCHGIAESAVDRLSATSTQLRTLLTSPQLKTLVAITVVSIVASWLAVKSTERPALAKSAMDAPELAAEMVNAAKNYVATLSRSQTSRGKFLFQDYERFNFHYFPIPRRGVALKDMDAGQRPLAYALLNTALSHRGFAKATTIMSLGELLRQTLEVKNPLRDADQYYVSIFGTPEVGATWGWRFEGFHVSVNVTIVEGRWIAVAPSFFGSRPAIVPDGPRAGLQVLMEEEEWGRSLAKSLRADQRKIAFGEIPDFLTETVGGLTTANRPKVDPTPARGIPVSKLSEEQVKLLMDLIREYAKRHRHRLAAQDLAKIEAAGVDKIHFAWDGSLERFEPHHYIIQGPTFIIEYDNTQDGANHVHSVWRDLENDFGVDMLRRHYRLHHRKKSG